MITLARRVALGWLLSVVLVGGPLPHRLLEWAEQWAEKQRTAAGVDLWAEPAE